MDEDLSRKQLNIEKVTPLSRDYEKGLILEGKARIMSFRVKTFQAFIDRLILVAGKQIGRVLLYQLGNEIGRTAMRYSKEEDVIGSEEDAKAAIDNVLRLRGWGTFVSLTKRIENKKDVYALVHAHCPLCFERTAAEPICDLMRGVFAGLIEEYLGRKAIESKEIACTALNHRNCVFEVTLGPSIEL